MSHFSVMVVGSDVESLMAPFQENNMEDCPEEFLEFEDCTQEVQDNWDREEYESIEEFAEKEYGYKKHGDRFGYMQNPNSFWDWYVIGGRYSGRLLSKGGDWVDRAQKKDIDIDGMIADAEKSARDFYDLVASKVNLTLPFQTCEEIKKWIKKELSPEARQREKLDAYHGQILMRQFANIELPENASESERNDFYRIRFLSGEDIKDLKKGRDEYAKMAGKNALPQYAFLRKAPKDFRPSEERVDGVVVNGIQWISRGDMGWFGCSSNEMDQESWNDFIAAEWNKIDENEVITIVDCHI